MNETQAIIRAFDEARGQGCAMATVVSVEGSAYRRPGARMLAFANGWSVGTISGGCLESDVVAHAERVIEAGAAKLIEYDTGSTSDDLAWGLGLGCNGVVRVLIEPLTPQSSYIAALRRSLGAQLNSAIATVIHQAPHGSQTAIGSRLIVDESGTRWSDLADAGLKAMMVNDARAALREGKSVARVYQTDGGGVTQVFVEAIAPPVTLMAFGAGHDVLPIIALARGLGWRTEIVDPQANPVSGTRFACADKVTLARPESVSKSLSLSKRTLTLVMTHNYTHDRALLKFLLASSAAYIGVLGPRKRTERILQELANSDRGFAFRGDHDPRLHAPAGLDIGAETPLEIALAIVAEMRAVLAARVGGNLRDRQAPIHDGPAVLPPLMPRTGANVESA